MRKGVKCLFGLKKIDGKISLYINQTRVPANYTHYQPSKFNKF